MGKTRKKNDEEELGNKTNGISYWKIVAIVAIIMSAGLIVRLLLYSPEATQSKVEFHQRESLVDRSLEKGVKFVASKFKCACGGCEEVPLLICECDRPRGAFEEKAFIRDKIRDGLPPRKVIRLVEERYGHKTS